MSDVIPFNKRMKTHEFILSFMDSPGHKRDADAYRRIFQDLPKESFAIFVLDEHTYQDELDAIFFNLRYLKKVDLHPVILLRARESTLRAMELETLLKKAQIPACFVENKPDDNESKLERLKALANDGTLPILNTTFDQNIVETLAPLTNLLNSKRVVLLRSEGGLLNRHTQSQARVINLRFERDQYFNSDDLSTYDKSILEKCDDLIRRTSHDLCISIVSPINLLRELFTVKGAGTLVQKGTSILSFGAWEEVNKSQLKVLLEDSFEKRLDENFFTKPMHYFYVEENYDGAAMVLDYGTMSYVSKFAVGTEARGFGVGQDLWETLLENHARIFWRSDSEAFINRWYEKYCDGMHRIGRWTIFWKGLEPSQISMAIEFAAAQEDDFFFET